MTTLLILLVFAVIGLCLLFCRGAAVVLVLIVLVLILVVLILVVLILIVLVLIVLVLVILILTVLHFLFSFAYSGISALLQFMTVCRKRTKNGGSKKAPHDCAVLFWYDGHVNALW